MNFTSKSLASVTIWYNPDIEMVENVNSYSGQVEKVIIVDNSLKDNSNLFNQIRSDNKIYITNTGNVGIATALNQGLNLLINDNYNFALTMDQDSYFETEQIDKLILSAKTIVWENVCFIASIPTSVDDNNLIGENQLEFKPTLGAITSGNIVNLAAAKKIGLFKDELFIDHVDHEFGLRAHMNNYKMFYTTAFLRHKLGLRKNVILFNKKIFSFTSHPPVRSYYAIRNGLYLYKTYGSQHPSSFRKKCIVMLVREAAKAFFEDRKLERFSLVYKAFIDYKRNKLGEYKNYAN